MSSQVEEYIRLLKTHDWTYDFSDNYSVWKKGQHERMILIAEQRSWDKEFIIWNKYCPKDFMRSV